MLFNPLEFEGIKVINSNQKFLYYGKSYKFSTGIFQKNNCILRLLSFFLFELR